MNSWLIKVFHSSISDFDVELRSCNKSFRCSQAAAERSASCLLRGVRNLYSRRPISKFSQASTLRKAPMYSMRKIVAGHASENTSHSALRFHISSTFCVKYSQWQCKWKRFSTHSFLFASTPSLRFLFYSNRMVIFNCSVSRDFSQSKHM